MAARLAAHHAPETVKARYYLLCRKHHPDAGGSSEKMAELNTAYETAKNELGV